MYESKISTGRNNFYKYQKSSYPRIFHNSSHFNHYKHSKYKYKYNYSNSSNKYEDKINFRKIFNEKNSKKHHNFKNFEGKEHTPIPNKFDNKENFYLNSNLYGNETRMKTKDGLEECENYMDKYSDENNLTSFIRKDSEEFLIEDNTKNKENEEENSEISEETLSEKNKQNNLRSDNINDNDNNYNIENIINDLLIKNNEGVFTQNEVENIYDNSHNDLYKTPQQFKINTSYSINKSNNNDINGALHNQRKINALSELYQTKVLPNCFGRINNSLNNYNFFTTIQKASIPLTNKNLKNLNNFRISSNNNLNTSNNTNDLMSSNYSKNDANNFNFPSFSNIPISSFNLFEPNLDNLNNIPKISQYFNINDNPLHNTNKNPFNRMASQLELNQCILRTQIRNSYLFEKDKENTDILEIYVKISNTNTLLFKIRRYDDMFRTVKIFCEINKLDTKLIRPLIIYIIKALNSIYGVYNLTLKKDEIEFLKKLKREFYDDENPAKKEDEEDSKKG